MLRIEELVKLLLDQEALLFGDFTLKSGGKSPYYINLGKLIKSGEGVAKIAVSLAGYIYANFLDASVPEDRRLKESELFLFGPAYKGIPMAASVAMALFDQFKVNVRWGFNRKEVKLHGDKDDTYMMGEIKDGDKVIILDDVITTGSTKTEAIDQIAVATGKQGLRFVAVVALIDRYEGAEDLRKHINVYGVLRIDSLVKTCHEKGWITEEQYASFMAYFKEHGLVKNP